MTLDSQSILHREPEVDLSIESNGEVTVRRSGQSVRLGSHGLLVLDAFRAPATITEAVSGARQRFHGAMSVDDFISDIGKLVCMGVLQSGLTRAAFSRQLYPLGLYDSPGLQISLLDDRVRRTAFLDAIAETVKAGDVVLDLGTGSGIMAVAAARAGARHIYAVEPSRIAAIARQVFDEAGLSDRITVIEGWIQDCTLPERADVLTYDIVGFEALDMALPEITREVRARFLRPGARLVPRLIRFSLLPVLLSRDIYAGYVVMPEHVERWKSFYGIDFAAFAAADCATVGVYLKPQVAAGLPALGVHRQVFELDLQAGDIEVPTVEVTFDDVPSSEEFAVLGIIEAQLSDSIWFSTDPRSAGEAPHWMVPVWFRGPAGRKAGGPARCRYTYQGRGRAGMYFV